MLSRYVLAGMCRLVAYHGPPIRLDELLYDPDHSIIDQSMHAREREEPLNGDGWGVGWYRPDLDPEPALHRRVRPAWNDDNMRHVAHLVETPLYFAHVRAASPGLTVQQLNCHPFSGGLDIHSETELDPVERGRRRLLFMHNGAIGAYDRVIRRLRESLPEDLYFGIEGSTDSEHAFAVVQDELGEAAVDPDPADLAAAVRAALERLERLKLEVGGGQQRTQANFCLTDGESIVATRFASPEDARAQTLYLGEAGSFESDGEFCATPDPTGDDATIVASEPIFEDERVWKPVPRNSIVTVGPDGESTVEPLDLDHSAPDLR